MGLALDPESRNDDYRIGAVMRFCIDRLAVVMSPSFPGPGELVCDPRPSGVAEQVKVSDVQQVECAGCISDTIHCQL